MLAFGTGMRRTGKKAIALRMPNSVCLGFSEVFPLPDVSAARGAGQARDMSVLRVILHRPPRLAFGLLDQRLLCACVFLPEGKGSVLSYFCVSGVWLIHLRCWGGVCGRMNKEMFVDGMQMVTLPALCCFECPMRRSGYKSFVQSLLFTFSHRSSPPGREVACPCLYLHYLLSLWV